MSARLLLKSTQGTAPGKEMPLHGPRVTIGRSPANRIVLDDRQVSKFHAEIIADGKSYVLCDLGSSNGTVVNGAVITRHLLKPGDNIELGEHHFTFLQGESTAADVSIVPKSPVDRTTVLAASKGGPLLPAKDIRDAEQLRASYERVRVAFNAVRELLKTTDIRALCNGIVEVAMQLLRAENGAVLLFDQSGNLSPLVSRWVDKQKNERIVVSRTIVDQVIQKKVAVLASDALTDSRWSSSQSVIMSGMRSIMCVPLLNNDTVYGLLHLGNSKEVSAFTPADLELLEGIGSGAGVALSNAFMAHRLEEEAQARESLGRFLSPVLVEQVLRHSIDLQRGGAEREVTIFFADIRGFTSLTERIKAADVVSMLNEYFDQMVEIVFRHGGILDKFIGDALMAVWGTPFSQHDDAMRAVLTAQEMQQTLLSLNELRAARGDEPIAIGIGLASGRCIAGAMGARRRLEYTVIGDAVNLASRLAGLAKPGQILCDSETFKRAGSPKTAKELPPTQVKGKTKPVVVFDL